MTRDLETLSTDLPGISIVAVASSMDIPGYGPSPTGASV